MQIKRVLSLVLAVIMVLGLTACGGSTDTGSDWEEYSYYEEVPTSSKETESKVESEKAPVSSQTASKTPSNNNTSSKKNDGTIARDVLIKKGTKPVSSGLNLGGKTVTYAIGVDLVPDVKLMIAQFENKYNCKVVTENLTFQDYVQMLAAKVAGKKTYDIVQVEGLRFPSIAIANMCEPLEDTVTTADFNNTGDVSKGGFDQKLSESFIWNNHLYAVVGVKGEYAPNMTILFYNKKIFKEAGAKDPRELYEAGKWNWDAFYEAGTIIAKNTTSKICDLSVMRRVNYFNDAWGIDISKPESPKAALTSSKMIKAYEFAQKCLVGPNAIALNENLQGTADSFIEGKVAMLNGFAFHLYRSLNIGESVEASNAFGKNLKNLGIVPVPLGPDNTRKAYQVGSWLYGIGAGVGTQDKRIAMSFAQFATTFTTRANTDYTYSAEDQKLLDQLQTGEKIWATESYSDGSHAAYELIQQMQGKIFQGEDIAQTLNSYNAQVQNCIDVTIGQQ